MTEIEHINRALPTSGHSPMYVMHKYFARKQADVIREYIQFYSKEGEIVLDPFCGSGVMVGEALRSGRKAIGIDINPVSIFITKNTVTPVDKIAIMREFKKMKADIERDINGLYMTRCRICKDNLIPAICYTWKEDKIVDIRYECPQHGKLISPVNDEDEALLEKITNGELDNFFHRNGKCKYWYPTNALYYADGTPFLKKERFNSVDEIFTKRNLIALAKLLDRIESIADDGLKRAFKFSFSSITHLASRMTPVRPTRPFSSAWVQQSYWYCLNSMESNVWDLFARAVTERQGLIKAKEDLPKDFQSKKEATKFRQLQVTGDYLLLTGSVIDILDKLEENSIDYVITDPPYGHSIQYAELLYMWGNWLKLMDDFGEMARGEIIENPKQKKTEKEYENLLHVAFRKVYRVLRPERYLTVTFHNPKLKYRNILFRAVLMAGFEFEKIVYQPPPRPSAKSLLQPFGSLDGDYFFRFKKPVIEKGEEFKTVDEKRVETLVVNITEKIIAERGEPTNFTFIQNTIDPLLYEELRKYGLLMDFQPKSVEQTLKKYIGSVFQLVDIEIGKKGKKRQITKGWWLIDPNKYRLDIPLNKRVEEAIVNFLHRNRKVTFTEVLTEVYTRFQNALTPEEYTIREILEENANMSSDGRWGIKPFVEEISKRHEEMIYYLALIGNKIGFKYGIAKDEYGKFYGGKRLDSLLKPSEIAIKDVKGNQLERIHSIDILWHDGKEVKALFEVEHSTSIVDAIIRGSNIRSTGVHRIMITPKEREDLVYRRFKEPAMQALMKDMKWTIITYGTLKKFFLKNEKNLKINMNDFLSCTREPLSKKQQEERDKGLSQFFEKTN
ncbi:MAG: DNA methyltransferase [Candidatus Odinarchaeota archaeon]